MGTFRLWFVSDKTADYKRSLGWLVHIQINSLFLSALVTPSAGAYALLKKCMMHYHHSSHLFHYRFFTVSSRPCEMLPSSHLSGLTCTGIPVPVMVTAFCREILILPNDCNDLPTQVSEIMAHWCSSWAWNWKQNHHTVANIRPNLQTGGSSNKYKKSLFSSSAS